MKGHNVILSFVYIQGGYDRFVGIETDYIGWDRIIYWASFRRFWAWKAESHAEVLKMFEWKASFLGVLEQIEGILKNCRH